MKKGFILPAAVLAASLPAHAQTAAPATDNAPAATSAAKAADNAGQVVTDTAPVMTLDDAVALALANNELLSQNDEAVNAYRARVRQATGRGLPQVTVNANITRQKEVVTEFPGSGGNTGVQRIVLSPGTTKMASVGLTQPIDIFGRVKTARNIAHMGERIQRLNVLRAQSEVVYEAKTAYYNTLRAEGAMTVAQASVADAEEQLRLARAFLAAGTAAQYDVTRAEVTLAAAQQTLLTAQDTVGLAGAALNNVLGRDVDTPLNLAPLTVTPDPSVDIPAQTAQALESRPEILQANLGISINESTADLLSKGNLPNFSFGANYSYNFTASGFNTNKGNWNAGVNMAWPVWDSGITRAEVAEAKSNTRVSKLQKQQLVRGVTLQVRQAGLSVTEAANRYGVANQAVASAEEALRLARVRYQNGVATQLEVIDAETQLTQVRTNRNNALYDYLTARADFDAALLGRLPSGALGAVTAGGGSSTGSSTGATAQGGVGGSTSAGARGGSVSSGAGQGQNF